MSELTENNNQDLFKILVAIAWIDGEIQSAEQEFLTKIAAEQNLEIPENLFDDRQYTSTAQCYDLLRDYLGSNPNAEDYNNLLSAVSTLIYSDDDIATEEASLLTKIQTLDPQNSTSNSSFDNVIGKIQKLYRKGIGKI